MNGVALVECRTYKSPPYLDLRGKPLFLKLLMACKFIPKAASFIKKYGLGIRRSIVYLSKTSTPIGVSPWAMAYPTSEELMRNVSTYIVSLEDKRFWSHSGIDYRSLLRAVIMNIKAGKIVQGGSTITQQLVRNSLVYPCRSPIRKIVECVLALKIEKVFSKKEILLAYCNSVYFGPGVRGVEAAVRCYYRIDGRRASIGELVSTLSCLRTPMSTSPLVNSAAYSDRALKILNRFSDIQRTYVKTPNPIRTQSLKKSRFSYISDHEIAAKSSLSNSINRVHLNLNTRFQKHLEISLREAFLYDSEIESTAGVILEVDTGRVVAEGSYVNGIETTFSPTFNGTIQGGSTYKPFILLEALDQGLPKEMVFESSPFEWTSSRFEEGVWRVRNYRSSYQGHCSLEQALKISDNTVYARLVQILGTEKVASRLRSFGLIGETESNPSAVLGSSKSGISLAKLARAYAALATGSLPPTPSLVRIVEYDDATFDRLSESKSTFLNLDSQHLDQIARIIRLNASQSGKSGTSGRSSLFGAYDEKYSYAIWAGFRKIPHEHWHKGVTAKNILEKMLDKIDKRTSIHI